MVSFVRILALFGVCCFSSATFAATIAGGFTSGPDSSFGINLTFLDGAESDSDIVSIDLDGSTALAFPILWDSAGSVSGPAGATVSIFGIDTQVLTIDFADAPDGFNPGESFSLNGMDPDGDPGPLGVTIGEMIGVQAIFSFRNGDSAAYVFVDDPQDGAGLKLAAVPIPAAVWLFGSALAGLGWLRRKQTV
jgi:hypothetical protein